MIKKFENFNFQGKDTKKKTRRINETSMHLFATLEGKGKKVYLVTFLNINDPEDVQNEFWAADDEDSLYDFIKKRVGADKPEDEKPFRTGVFGNPDFDEAWGDSILFQHIGIL